MSERYREGLAVVKCGRYTHVQRPGPDKKYNSNTLNPMPGEHGPNIANFLTKGKA